MKNALFILIKKSSHRCCCLHVANRQLKLIHCWL